jgi:23S rRNA (guanine2445-N2)-methyltransferase / 23S rRNA (guanine2069-N7)-methyltransferase
MLRLSDFSPNNFEAFMFPIHVRTAGQLEKVLAQELREIGLTQIKIRNRVVVGTGDLETLYQANLCCRTAIRVLRPIANFAAENEQAFYDFVKQIDWNPWLSPTGTLAIDAHVHSSFTTHSLFLAQLTKDAIVDQFREKTGDRPSVDLENPDLRIAVNLYRNQVEISVDASGESLHRRGYRKKAGEAPLNETLAAGILKLTGWTGSTPLIDPMTGSGTFGIEAALMAKNIAPGLLRSSFGFQKWKDYDQALFDRLVQEAKEKILEKLPAPILLWDKDPKMVAIAKENIERAGLTGVLNPEVKDFFDASQPTEASGTLVMNPPYDERLPVEDMAQFCSSLGKNLKKNFSGWRAFILLGNLEASREIGMNPIQKTPLFNGALECELLEFAVGPLNEFVEDSNASSTVELPPKSLARIEAFSNRLKKNLKHYSKWAQRERITCWRLYDRDIPELPFIVDILGRNLHVAEAPRNHDHSPLQHLRYLELIKKAAAEVVQVSIEKVYFKVRKAQKLPKTETMAPVEVKEGSLKFLVNLKDYVEFGLPLEFRKVRRWIEKEAANKDFLNLYSYTGTATVAAANGGAKSTASVDSSSTYLDWARHNMELNQLKGSQHIFYRSDVMEFLNDSKKFYDFCWVDPPVHSVNRTTTQEFNIQEDHVLLLQKVLERMRPGGKVLFTTHCQDFELKQWAIQESCRVTTDEITHTLIPPDFEKSQPFRAWLIEKSR